MKDVVLKIDLFFILGVLGMLIPVWNHLEKILQFARTAAAERAEIHAQLEFLQQRLDRIDNWINSNSGINHK